MVAVEEGTLERASWPRELAGSRARAGILYSLTLNYMQVRTRTSGVLEHTIFHRVCCKRRKLQTGFHLSLTRRGKGEDVEAEVGRSVGWPAWPSRSLSRLKERFCGRLGEIGPQAKDFTSSPSLICTICAKKLGVVLTERTQMRVCSLGLIAVWHNSRSADDASPSGSRRRWPAPCQQLVLSFRRLTSAARQRKPHHGHCSPFLFIFFKF